MEINLPCRLRDERVLITLIFRPCPANKHRVEVEVVVPGWLGRRDAYTFRIDAAKVECGALAKDLQRLYDTRDVTITPSLLHMDVGESYIAFRAHDLEAEQIGFMRIFRYHGYPGFLPDDPLDEKLSKFEWYQEEKQVLFLYAWLSGFHGYLMKRDHLPEIIAKLKRIAEGGSVLDAD